VIESSGGTLLAPALAEKHGGHMSRRTYGIIAGMVGSALGAWWYSRRRSASNGSSRDRGTVIYHNTPSASPSATEGIV
jgi:hypothetical protein